MNVFDDPNIVAGLYWLYLHGFIYMMNLGWLSAFGVMYFSLEPENKNLRFWFSMLGITSISAPILFCATYFSIQHIGNEALPVPVPYLENWAGLFAVGIISMLVWYRLIHPRINVILSKFKRDTNLERNQKTDVRDIWKVLPKALKFDPLKFVNIKKGFFVGLEESRKPLYLTCPSGSSIPHTQVVSTSGSGKGVFMGLMASQCLERGEAVFYFDPKGPKGDEWGPHVLFDTAKRTGKPFHYININRPNGAQLNPCFGATEDEIFEALEGSMSLIETGGPSDFYTIADRHEARITAKLMSTKGLNFAQAYAERKGKMDGAEKFEGKLRELSEMPSINSVNGQGVDLAKVINEGGCVYIVGSMRNSIVKTVQRLMLIRLVQLAERRDRIKGGLRPVSITLDEAKSLISRPVLESMAAARDKNIHLTIAHQSLGDLRDCTRDLNPDGVVDAIVENCKLKVSYRVMSPDTAEWMASMSGTVQVDDESRKVTRNIAQAEIVSPERNIKQAERYYIDQNMLLNLPAGVAVLYGDGLPKFVSICPLKVVKTEQAVSVVTVDGSAAPCAADDINIDDSRDLI